MIDISIVYIPVSFQSVWWKLNDKIEKLKIIRKSFEINKTENSRYSLLISPYRGIKQQHAAPGGRTPYHNRKSGRQIFADLYNSNGSYARHLPLWRLYMSFQNKM